MTVSVSTANREYEWSSNFYFCEVSQSGDAVWCRFDAGSPHPDMVHVYDTLRIRLTPFDYETTITLLPMQVQNQDAQNVSIFWVVLLILAGLGFAAGGPSKLRVYRQHKNGSEAP
jgi:hypothetical protein